MALALLVELLSLEVFLPGSGSNLVHGSLGCTKERHRVKYPAPPPEHTMAVEYGLVLSKLAKTDKSRESTKRAGQYSKTYGTAFILNSNEAELLEWQAFQISPLLRCLDDCRVPTEQKRMWDHFSVIKRLQLRFVKVHVYARAI